MAVLYRKYRPQTFKQMVGQDNVVEALRKSVTAQNTPHALLFVGPKGSGKTTTARIFAKALNCPNVLDGDPCGQCEVCEEIASGAAVDVIEIDGASNRKIDDVREIRDKISLSPSRFKKKVYIIDEVHMLTKEAFNALLKTLEEPPEHAVFILCTTEPDKLPATIISRCQRFDFNLGKSEDIKNYLSEILGKENVKYDEEALLVVAEYASGSFRDALSMAGQVAVFEKVTVETVESVLGKARDDYARKFVEALLNSQKDQAVEVVSKLSEKGFDATEFVRLSLIEVKNLLVGRITGDKQVNYSKDSLVNLYSSLDKCYQRLKYSPVVELPIFLVIAEMIEIDSHNTSASDDVPSEKSDKENNTAKGKNKETRQTVKLSDKTVNSEVGDVQTEDKSVDEDLEQNLNVPDQLQVIYNNWKSILENLKSKNNYVTTILRGAKPTAFDGSKVTVEVYFRLHQDKLREARVLSLVESSMSEVLGKKVFLIINLGKKEITSTSDLSIENLVEAAGEIFGTSN